MTQLDLDTIEKELGIKLPPHYVKFILKFKGFGPEDDDWLYSKPDMMLFWNKTVPFYSNTKFIKYRLIVGDNGGGDYYLINLEDPKDEKVYIFDHEESVEKAYDAKTQIFNWKKVDSHKNLKTYRDHIIEIFGL